MELQIGGKIAEFRKKIGLTQEQLAEKLGVSAPAVSKWETGQSYPDIALLCPLARVLETDVDTLLAYEKDLPQEKINESIQEILMIKNMEGAPKAEEKLQKLLLQYPSSNALKFQAVALMSMFEMQAEQTSEEDIFRWKTQKKRLLMEIYESRDLEYYSAAVSALAGLEMQEENLDEAEKYLKELPDPVPDSTALWSVLYTKRGQIDKAMEVVQKSAYSALNLANSCFVRMIEQIVEEGSEESERLPALCSAYKKLDEILFGEVGNSEILLAGVYAKTGNRKKAIEVLYSYLTTHAEHWPVPNAVIFAPAIHQPMEAEVSKEVKLMMLRGILSDENLKELCEEPEIKEALKKWE